MAAEESIKKLLKDKEGKLFPVNRRQVDKMIEAKRLLTNTMTTSTSGWRSSGHGSRYFSFSGLPSSAFGLCFRPRSRWL